MKCPTKVSRNISENICLHFSQSTFLGFQIYNSDLWVHNIVTSHSNKIAILNSFNKKFSNIVIQIKN